MLIWKGKKHKVKCDSGLIMFFLSEPSFSSLILPVLRRLWCFTALFVCVAFVSVASLYTIITVVVYFTPLISFPFTNNAVKIITF